MNRDDKRPAIKNGRVKMGKMHEIEFFVIENIEKIGLLGNRIMRGVHKNFFHPLVRRREMEKLRFVKK